MRTSEFRVSLSGSYLNGVLGRTLQADRRQDCQDGSEVEANGAIESSRIKGSSITTTKTCGDPNEGGIRADGWPFGCTSAQVEELVKDGASAVTPHCESLFFSVIQQAIRVCATAEDYLSSEGWSEFSGCQDCEAEEPMNFYGLLYVWTMVADIVPISCVPPRCMYCVSFGCSVYLMFGILSRAIRYFY